ncbi:MAG TPA: WecB/TagA/CpsF family glycosyltransferase [Solimonas sp.]|nr:WecB/TagA/CpsF family glycosyltransferase [Solimonas sp.]
MQQQFAFDDYDLDRLTEVVAHFGQQKFGYVVTPNTDHMIRLHQEPSLRPLYDGADFMLLDSRFIALVLRTLRGVSLPVCTGSDLTARLFGKVIGPEDRVVLIGASDAQARSLAQRYGLQHLEHYNPPMGFIRDPAEVERCLAFVEAHSPFRFCLMAVGAPQQEMLSRRLKDRGLARGLALCIGASIDFLTGKETRAPQWMQQSGLEWLYRLAQNPRRLAYRYLVRGPRIFPLLGSATFMLRRPQPLPATA